MTTHFGPESHAMALDEIAGGQPMPISPETPFTATLTAQEWNMVEVGLRELPMKYVEQVTMKLRTQLRAQAHRVQQHSQEE